MELLNNQTLLISPGNRSFTFEKHIQPSNSESRQILVKEESKLIPSAPASESPVLIAPAVQLSQEQIRLLEQSRRTRNLINALAEGI